MVIRSLPIFFFIAIVAFGCHTEKIVEPGPVEIQESKLIGTWTFSSVTINGVMKSEYKDYTLTFTKHESDGLIHFTSTGRPADCEFPESGSLKFGTDIENDWVLVTPAEWDITYYTDGSVLQFTFTSSKPREPSQEEIDSGLVLPIIPTWLFELKK